MLLIVAFASRSSATTCIPHEGGFAEQGRWPLNRVLIVKIVRHHYVTMGGHRLSLRMDVQVLEDVSAAELRPRVRVLSSDPLALDDDSAFPLGSLWALALERPPAYAFRDVGVYWGPDASPIDYYLGCGSAVERLTSLAESERGPVGEVKAYWRKRDGRTE
jgi:hypothetical protein